MTISILNYGSINEDRVYRVHTIVRPGETVPSLGYQVHAGGKGANQSVALARAGATVHHLGKVGHDGDWLRNRLLHEGIKTECVTTSEGVTGHAAIQVDDAGENSIVLHGGANHDFVEADIHKALETVTSLPAFFLAQNETTLVPYALRRAHDAGFKVCFNPAPMTSTVNDYPLEIVDVFFLNESEAAGLSGQTNTGQAMTALSQRFPHASIVLTLGAEGVLFTTGDRHGQLPAHSVNSIDTTGAGDAFIGFCLAGLAEGMKLEGACALGSVAGALTTTVAGAMDAIPSRAEVEKVRLNAKV